MLNEKQIPETDTFMIEVSHYEKHLIIKAIGDSISDVERYIESTYTPREEEQKKEWEKLKRNLEQKITDLKRVSERIM